MDAGYKTAPIAQTRLASSPIATQPPSCHQGPKLEHARSGYLSPALVLFFSALPVNLQDLLENSTHRPRQQRRRFLWRHRFGAVRLTQ